MLQEETKPSQSPVATPRKRMTRAEKALMESEQLLKSLGVSMESGRQTRSSRRGPAVESPKPEPVKRKPPASTPRRTKKAKISESDQTDATNHVEESKPDEAQQVNFTLSLKFKIVSLTKTVICRLPQPKQQKKHRKNRNRLLRSRRLKRSLNQKLLPLNRWKLTRRRSKAHRPW